MIPFNVPLRLGTEIDYIRKVIDSGHLCGDGLFTRKCHQWLEGHFNTSKALLTTSCTHALEMAAILLDIQKGDEVIAPSYTFVSTVNAFVLRGAKIVFVDIRPDTMNLNEDLIEEAITSKTKVIIPVHYAGVSCEMDKILALAEKYHLSVVEDAAQGVMSSYKDKMLGTIGGFGCYSFHETKNYSMGEGGALLVNRPDLLERAEIIREKGTDRSRFIRGQVDKYTWRDMGSSYLPSEITAAHLYGQLQEAEAVNQRRLFLWESYYEKLKPLMQKEKIGLPFIPPGCRHNAHMFYIKCQGVEQRTELIEYLKERDIQTVFHYIPLHSSPAGIKFGRFCGSDKYTTWESQRLLRLPMYYNLSIESVNKIVECIYEFYRDK